MVLTLSSGETMLKRLSKCGVISVCCATSFVTIAISNRVLAACKIIIGSNFALPAACLCICIHLEQVSAVRQARTSALDKRRRQMIEGLVCFGLPLLFMGLRALKVMLFRCVSVAYPDRLDYVVQGHRFDIIEEYGCRPTTYVSIPAIFIVWIPPLLMSIATLVFAGVYLLTIFLFVGLTVIVALAFRHFIHRRLSFATHLSVSNSALTTSRYLRLMAMSAVEMIWSISATSYTIWFTIINVPLRPWINWDFVHSNFSRIDIYPAAFMPVSVATTYYTLWWMLPASSFVFVAFFAFGQDTVDEYKAWFTWFKRRVLRMPDDKSKGSFGSLPFLQ
jgi:pheromone a factor receptor